MKKTMKKKPVPQEPIPVKVGELRFFGEILGLCRIVEVIPDPPEDCKPPIDLVVRSSNGVEHRACSAFIEDRYRKWKPAREYLITNLWCHYYGN